MPDATTLTETYRASSTAIEAMRFLMTAASRRTDTPTIVAQHFVEENPRALVTPGLRKALLEGELVQKAVAVATTDVAAYAGGLLPPALLNPLIARIQAASVLSRIPGVVSAPVNVPIPYESAAPSLKWVAQGAPKPASTLSLTSVILPLYKFSGILVESAELAKATNTGSDAVLTARLVNASTRFLDEQLLSPAVAAVADQNPKSLTNGLTPVAAGATLEDTVTALIAAFWTARPTATAPTFVLSPSSVMTLTASGKHQGLLTTGAGTLRGAPAVTTIGAGANLILLDAAGIYAHDSGGVVDISREAILEMEVAPASPPTASTILLDLWQRNLIGFRLDRWCSWAAEPTAVQYAVGT